MADIVPAGFRSLPLAIAQLSLAAVLKCGQSFRWSIYPLLASPPPQELSPEPTHEYRLCLRDRVVCLRQTPHTLFYRAHFPSPAGSSAEQDVRDAATLAWIRDYFQLDVDLSKLYEDWARRDPVFNAVQGRFAGIRVLRQDPWENLVS
jgi:N-glycosylase/DNA lyase